MAYHILPKPKSIIYKDGSFPLFECRILIESGIDKRIIKAALNLKEQIESKTGNFHNLALSLFDAENPIYIKKDASLKNEGYVLDISSDVITITGGDDAGCFYGIKTLLQILNDSSCQIDALVIEDYPDMKHRGFYHDATRGRVPSVEGVKKLVDLLALHKMNSLQLYVEHTFDFSEFKSDNRTADDYLTAEEILEIDEYCYDNFIDFIPSLSTFGHLYELLSKKEYSHLCELENYVPKSHFWRERMMHHTIDPLNPESFEVIKSLIDQYLPLFRSNYFNICCDETFDLAKGRNQGKDSATLYIDFVSKIIEYVRQKGKTVMMWGDIALKHPELLPRIPNDTILLNWGYDANPNTQRIDKVGEKGLTQIVCPGNNSWYSFIEFIDVSIPNISKMVLSGYQNKALGMLNTNWGDYGHPAHTECTLYGTVFSACISWNVDTKADSEFNKDISKLVYGTDLDMSDILLKLGRAQKTAHWLHLYDWVENRNAEKFTASVEEIEGSITDCKEICEKLNGCGYPLSVIKITAKGVELLNHAVLQIKSVGKLEGKWRSNANLWFEEYKKCWLKSSKPSELGEIHKFINKI